MFSGSILEGLAGLTLSPSRGLFIFSPLVVGAYGVWTTRLSERSPRPAQETILLARYATVAGVAVLLGLRKYLVWWGGHGFGPRYLTDIMPFVGLLIGLGLVPVVASIRARGVTLVTAVVVALAVHSVAVQAVGAFCWPSPWTLDNTRPYVQRLWEWRDSQIVSCARSGPRVDPMARRLLARFGL